MARASPRGQVELARPGDPPISSGQNGAALLRPRAEPAPWGGEVRARRRPRRPTGESPCVRNSWRPSNSPSLSPVSEIVVFQINFEVESHPTLPLVGCLAGRRRGGTQVFPRHLSVCRQCQAPAPVLTIETQTGKEGATGFICRKAGEISPKAAFSYSLGVRGWRWV